MKLIFLRFCFSLTLFHSMAMGSECDFHFVKAPQRTTSPSPSPSPSLSLSYKMKTAVEVNEFLLLLKSIKESNIKVGLETLGLSPLIKRKLISFKDINDFFSSKGSLSQLETVISKNALVALSKAESAKELINYVRIIKRSGLEKILPPDYLANTPIIRKKILNERVLYNSNEEEIKKVVKNELHNYLNSTSGLDQLLEAVEMLKYSDFSSSELSFILSPLRKLGGEFAHLDALTQAIDRSLKNGRLDINKFIGDHLKNTFLIMSTKVDDDAFSQILSKVKSGYNFSLAVKRIAQLRKTNPFYFWDELARSPFGKTNDIDKDLLKKIYKELLEGDDFSLDEVIKTIESHRPHLRESGKLLSLDNYDKSIKVTSIKDQCNYGACWMHAGLSRYELTLKEKLGDDFELSTDYLYYKYISDEYKRVLRLPNPSYSKVIEGGANEVVPEMIRKYGIVPKLRVKSGAVEGVDATLFVNSRISRIKEEIEEVYLKFNSSSIKDDQALRIYEEQIDSILAKHISVSSSTTFKFEGQTHTPHTFAKQYVDDAFEARYEGMSTKDGIKTWRGNYREYDAKGDYKVFSFNINKVGPQEIEETIRKSIDDGRPVQLTINWPNDEKVLNNQSGIMRGDVFSLKEHFLQSGGAHAVLIIGYELNHKGGIQTFKILNSYGDKMGDYGIYHMDKSFFDKYLHWISVDKNTGLGYRFTKDTIQLTVFSLIN